MLHSLNLKKMPSNFKFKYGFKAKAERLSEEHRTQLSLTKFDALDAFLLADHLDIPIITIDELKASLPSNFYKTLCDTDKFSAMWTVNEDGDKFIIHNNHHSPKRQQSNLMHELAHIILNHQISPEAARLCFLTGLHYFNKEQEQEAKYLGACLQITRPGLLWALKQGFSNSKISDYYKASPEMVTYRLNISGVLIQRSFVKSYK